MDFKIEPMPQVSAYKVILERTYHKVIGKSGNIWLHDDLGSTIYFSAPDPNSQGFGGRLIPFPLKDGSTLKLKGCWHSNSTALFEDTGVDLREKHYTYGAYSLEINKDCSVLPNCIHADTEPTLGLFNRIELAAKEAAKKLQQVVYFYSSSEGGSHRSSINPKD